ncbi:hypothetical protein STEG23_005749, partial [Scotinomys teguina]
MEIWRTAVEQRIYLEFSKPLWAKEEDKKQEFPFHTVDICQRHLSLDAPPEVMAAPQN